MHTTVHSTAHKHTEHDMHMRNTSTFPHARAHNAPEGEGIPSKVNARENVPMRVPRTKFAFLSPIATVPRKHAVVVALIQLTVRHTLLSSVLPITTVPERSYLFSKEFLRITLS